MRNGPNPRYKPISYTYPLDGDGMIHAVSFENGRARYRNRFVRTRSFEIERAAGHAVFGGVMRPVPVDPQAARPRRRPERPVPSQGAFISVMHHGDHLLALGEASPAWELDPRARYARPMDRRTDKPIALGAHNRRHPVTGDSSRSARPDEPDRPHPPYRPRRPAPPQLPGGARRPEHDPRLRADRAPPRAPDRPRDLRPGRRGAGKPFLQWRPDLGTRIGVVSLDGGDPRWIEAEPFFVFHFANGFERGSEIVIDYVRHERLNLGYADPPPGAAERCAASPSTPRRQPRRSAARRLRRRVPPHRRPPRRPRPPLRLRPDADREPPAPGPAVGHLQRLLKIDAETGATTATISAPHRRRGGLHPARRSRGRGLARDLPLRPRRRDAASSRSSTPQISTPGPSR